MTSPAFSSPIGTQNALAAGLWKAEAHFIDDRMLSHEEREAQRADRLGRDKKRPPLTPLEEAEGLRALHPHYWPDGSSNSLDVVKEQEAISHLRTPFGDHQIQQQILRQHSQGTHRPHSARLSLQRSEARSSSLHADGDATSSPRLPTSHIPPAKQRPHSAGVTIVPNVEQYFADAAAEREQAKSRPITGSSHETDGVHVAGVHYGVGMTSSNGPQVGTGNIGTSEPPMFPFDPRQRPVSPGRRIPQPPARGAASSRQQAFLSPTAANAIPSSVQYDPSIMPPSMQTFRPQSAGSGNTFLRDFDELEMEAMLKLLGKPSAPYSPSSWKAGSQFLGGIDHRIMKVPCFKTMSPRQRPQSASLNNGGNGESIPSNIRPAENTRPASAITLSPRVQQDSHVAPRHTRGVSMDKMIARPQQGDGGGDRKEVLGCAMDDRRRAARAAEDADMGIANEDDGDTDAVPSRRSHTADGIPKPPSSRPASRPTSATAPFGGGIPRGSTRASLARVVASHANRKLAGGGYRSVHGTPSGTRPTLAHAAPLPDNHSPSCASERADEPTSSPRPKRAEIIYDYSSFTHADSHNQFAAGSTDSAISSSDRAVRRHVPAVNMSRQISRNQASYAAGGAANAAPPSIEAMRRVILDTIGTSGTIASYIGFKDRYERTSQVKGEPKKRSLSMASGGYDGDGSRRIRSSRVQPDDDEEILAQMLIDEPERRYVLSDLGEARVRAKAALRAHYRHRPYGLPSRYDDGGIAATASLPHRPSRSVSNYSTTAFDGHHGDDAPSYMRSEHPVHRYGATCSPRVKGFDVAPPRFAPSASHSGRLKSTKTASGSVQQAGSAPGHDKKSALMRAYEDEIALRFGRGDQSSAVGHEKRGVINVKNTLAWRKRSVFDAYGPQ